MSVQFDLNDIIRKAVETAFKELSTVTVLIAGRTGVGKSTLINAVFAGNMATTGQGRPITTCTRSRGSSRRSGEQ
jgi:predicted GTPase